MAQWAEMVRDSEQKIARPRQIYIGETLRHYTALSARPKPTQREDAVSEAI
jgi:citrate synthase